MNYSYKFRVRSKAAYFINLYREQSKYLPNHFLVPPESDCLHFALRTMHKLLSWASSSSEWFRRNSLPRDKIGKFNFNYHQNGKMRCPSTRDTELKFCNVTTISVPQLSIILNTFDFFFPQFNFNQFRGMRENIMELFALRHQHRPYHTLVMIDSSSCCERRACIVRTPHR